MAPRPKPFDELGDAIPISDEQRKFMHRRVGGLLHYSEVQRPLIDLIANAYLLGLIDAQEVIRGTRP
jgi:hypothetical protein